MTHHDDGAHLMIGLTVEAVSAYYRDYSNHFDDTTMNSLNLVLSPIYKGGGKIVVLCFS